jgi:hypothetical protein
MNHTIPTLLIFLVAGLAQAEVPALINYQGRLLDSNGDPVTGTVSIGLNIYDAQTGGNAIYTESIGSVPLVDGVYSFQFGGSGQSVVTATESIATSDGTTKIYTRTLANSPIDGTISIADGTYTWSQSAGSSNNSEFSAAVNVSTKEVFATYLATAPASGTQVQASYQYYDTSIAGALATGSEHWLELSIDSVVQSSRERLVAVPFAMYAARVWSGSPKLKRTVIGFWQGTLASSWSTTPILNYIHRLNLPVGSRIIRVEVDLEDNDTSPYNTYHPIEFRKIGRKDERIFQLTSTDFVERKWHYFEIDEKVDGQSIHVLRIGSDYSNPSVIIHEVAVVWEY